MKLHSRLDTADNMLQTARDIILQDSGKYEYPLSEHLILAAQQIEKAQARLRDISDADGWRVA